MIIIGVLNKTPKRYQLQCEYCKTKTSCFPLEGEEFWKTADKMKCPNCGKSRMYYKENEK